MSAAHRRATRGTHNLDDIRGAITMGTPLTGPTARFALILLLLLAPALGAARAEAQSIGPAAVRSGAATRAEVGPTIDGRLDEAVWDMGQPLSGFVQHEPVEGAPATEATEVKILFDDEALYVGAWMYDREPNRIIPGERRRDANMTDVDAILLVLDTYHDQQNGFVFGTNPGGIEYDGQVRGERGADTNWDGSWTVAASQDGDGWYAEIRIPFSTLRYGAGVEQTWGLNLTRYIGRKNEQVVWSPVPRQFGFYRLTEAGVLASLQPPPRRQTTLTPYLMSAAQRLPSGDPALDPDVNYPFEYGADAKIGITPSLALDLTVNTDFAQVEVDDQQVDLSRYSLFFPEKRLFFLENAGLFSVGIQSSPGCTGARTRLFHSRRIGVASGQQVPIDWGGRLSGRVQGMDVGLLHMRTGGLPGVQDPAGWSVARIARELPNRSQLGAIYTSRDSRGGSGDYGPTYAFDGRLGIGDIWTFSALAGLSDTPEVDTGREILSFVGEFRNRDWYLRAYYDQVGENFNPDLGFVSYPGFRETALQVERTFRPAAPWMMEVRFQSRRNWAYNTDGFKELDFFHEHLYLTFENGSTFHPAINWVHEGLTEPFRIRGTGIEVPAGTYRGWTSYATFRTNPSAPVSLNGRYDVGTYLSGNRPAETWASRSGGGPRSRAV